MSFQETPTSELVEIIRQQAENTFQKPKQDNAVWRELMVRYGWIGCPKEDLALISSLDSLLRPLNNGNTLLPPRVMCPPGAAIPLPPPYYKGKIKLSQAISVPGEQTGKRETRQTEKAMPQEQKSFLDKLRAELSSSQQKYLNLFWEHYLEYGQWPKTIDFHRDHDIKEVHESLGAPPLNGSIVREQNGGGDEHYELDLIGILLTKDGKHYEEMRIRLLEFLSKKYYHTKREDRKSRYSDEEVAAEIQLNENDRKILGKVSQFDYVYRTYHTSSEGDRWAIEFPRKEIQSIPREAPFSAYHEKMLVQQYHPEWKVLVEDRNAALRSGIPAKSNIFEYLSTPANSDSPAYSEPKKEQELNNGSSNSPWISGSFYLFAFATVIVLLAALAKVLPIWVLPLVFFGGLLSITIIGALQLRNDSKIEEKNFLLLMKLALQKMPLLGKLIR